MTALDLWVTKKDIHAHSIVSFMYNPDAPFGLQPIGRELGAERLMAKRKRRGRVLKSYADLTNLLTYIEMVLF